MNADGARPVQAGVQHLESKAELPACPQCFRALGERPQRMRRRSGTQITRAPSAGAPRGAPAAAFEQHPPSPRVTRLAEKKQSSGM
jgi:hypothetical protein